MASAGWRNETGAPSTEQLAAARAFGAGEDVEQLVLALALERDDAEHLARVQVERDVLQLRARRRARGPTRRGLASAGRRVPRPRARRRPACPRRSCRASARRSAPRSPSVTSTTPTVSPSRSTVARSQTAAISIMRWEMKMTDRSPPRCRPMTSRTRSVRLAGSAAVISSSIRTSGSIARARARSMIRSEASGTRRARLDRSRSSRPSSREPVAERLDRRLGQAQVRADVEVRDERRLLVDRDEAAAARLGR